MDNLQNILENNKIILNNLNSLKKLITEIYNNLDNNLNNIITEIELSQQQLKNNTTIFYEISTKLIN